MKTKKKFLNVVIVLLLSILAVTYLYPIFYLIVNSLKNSTEYYTSKFAMPKALAFDNFKVMISQFKITKYLFNSFIVAGGNVLFVSILSLFAGYGFSKLKFRGSDTVYLIMILTMMIPAQVTIIPVYTLFSRMGLINTRRGLIICYLATALPSSIMLLTANFRGIPDELFESASLDGANYFQKVIYILAPLGKTALVLNGIFNFIWTWNDLFMPTVMLQKNEVKTVMVALSALMSRYSKNPTLQLTGLLLCVIPALIIYCAFQKYIVKGITMGSIK